MKHKVAELEGALLDAAVAMAEGLDADLVRGGYAPSRRWHDGGPIIERERITVLAQVVVHSGVALNRVDETWEAERGDGSRMPGQTPLIAAMRAYVASKFGDEVELP